MNLRRQIVALCMVLVLLTSSMTSVFAANAMGELFDDSVQITSDERAISATYIEDDVMYVLEIIKEDMSLQYFSQPVAASDDSDVVYYDVEVIELNEEHVEFIIDEEYHVVDGEVINETDSLVQAAGTIVVPAGWAIGEKIIIALLAVGSAIWIDGNVYARAEEMFFNLNFDKYDYFRAAIKPDSSLQTRPMTLYVGEGLVFSKAKQVMLMNSSNVGVIAATEYDAYNLTLVLGGSLRYERHCKHEYYNAFYHYHCKSAPDAHLWHF